MKWTEFGTFIVAAYGAILATYNMIMRSREKKSIVHVKISLGFITFALGGTSEEMIFLTASNPGQKVVTLSSQGFILPNGMSLVIPSPQSDTTFPCELLPGKNCQIWIGAREMTRTLKANSFSGKVRLIGFYRDQVDRIFKSKPFKFNVYDWGK
jgi:hypothetical protein